MSIPTKNRAEVKRIDAQIEMLQARRRLLMRQAPAQWLLQHMLPGEKANARNLDKLIALAHTKGFLQQGRNSEGAETKEISAYLNNSIGLNIKPATLRSYLSRFKEERRIEYDDERRVWRLP